MMKTTWGCHPTSQVNTVRNKIHVHKVFLSLEESDCAVLCHTDGCCPHRDHLSRVALQKLMHWSHFGYQYVADLIYHIKGYWSWITQISFNTTLIICNIAAGTDVLRGRLSCSSVRRWRPESSFVLRSSNNKKIIYSISLYVFCWGLLVCFPSGHLCNTRPAYLQQHRSARFCVKQKEEKADFTELNPETISAKENDFVLRTPHELKTP